MIPAEIDMIDNLNTYLQDARKLESEAFIQKHPNAMLVQYSQEPSPDPRSEYRSTLRMRIDPRTKELKTYPTSPSPFDRVIELVKSDRNSFAQKILVGRTETNDIVISDLTVSKHHAFFRFDEQALRMSLTDTGSTNGTLINGATLDPRQSRYLSDGDQVTFGDIHFVFYSASGFFDLLTSITALQ
jgi:pSer/pThr/pTyr-binding forkhead associated (FHA) protein